jgi:phage shock protein C
MTKNKLYRSSSEKMLGGVCGGLADFFGLDVTVIRLIFVLLAILGGHGVLIYLLLWIIAPQEPLVVVPPPAPAEPPQAV